MRILPLYIMSLLASLGAIMPAHADDWSSKAEIALMTGAFQGATDKSALNGATVSLGLDYLERGGGKLVVSTLTIDQKSGYPINQKALFASGYYNQFCDSLGGVVRMRFDVHQINLNNDLLYQDGASIYAPSISFLNYGQSFYADMGFALSTYENGVEIKQITPTLGFAWGRGANWLQTRGYFMTSSDSTLTQAVDSSQALALKYTHWNAPDAMFSQIFIHVLLGERMYAVDGDGAAVYSLGDRQQGGGAIGAAWKTARMSGMMMLGVDNYLNSSTNQQYISNFAYINVSKSW